MHIHPSSPNSAHLSQSEESAAIKIQAGFRGFRVRKQLHHRQTRVCTATTTNGYQSHHRNSSHRRHHQRRHHQQQYMMDNSSGTTSDSNSMTTATAQLRNEDSNGSVEDRCATKIQAGVRGFLVRKKQKIATDAATKIQASFRGFKVRKEAQKLKQK